MASIRILLRKKPNKEGLYPIILRVIKNRKSKLINLGMNCRGEDWDSQLSKFKKSYTNFNQRNRVLLKIEEKALEIIDEFRINEIDFSLKQFEEKFRGNKSLNLNIIDFFDEIIDEMQRSGRIGNAKVNKETKNALIKYKGTQLKIKDITPTFLQKFEVRLREKGNKDSSIAIRMRALRAIFKQAINRGIVKEEFYPFKVYKISKLKGKSRKKALTIDEYKKIRDLDLSKHPHLVNAHNYFMFSFYTRGMNFVDMMKLKWSDIQTDKISYTRSKTKGRFVIEILTPVKDILNYYKKQNRITDYVFPILLKESLTPQQIYNRKHKTLRRFNKDLKEIAKLLGITKNLTSYVARHTYATIMKQKGTATDIISESMGHANLQVTMTYLKEFENDVIDNANSKLLDI